MMAARKAIAGFIIPPRTMPEMFYSAMNGLFSLLHEKNRTVFVNSLENGTLQEEVLSQATAGQMMMISLFHDLQSPLFKKYKFDPLVFIEGLAPALENFHNVSGALENELYEINNKALAGYEKKVNQTDDNNDLFNDNGNGNGNSNGNDNKNQVLGDISKEEKESLLSALRIMTHNDDNLDSEKQKKDAEAILNYEWMKEAERNPESVAASLSRMVTKELFQINQLSSKTAFLLQNQSSKNMMFREGSCEINNVALLSARACLFKRKKRSTTDDNKEIINAKGIVREYEAVDFNYDDDDGIDSETAVAAQIDILYDVTQEFLMTKSLPSSTSTLIHNSTEKDKDTSSLDTNSSESTEYTPVLDTDGESTQTTIVSVATIEGWLHNGPDDGKLRWKLASYRPPYEFRGLL